MKTYYIKTLGCQMNVSDSERIAGLLEKYNLKPARDIKKADLIVFNTCGVRQMAEDRVYGQIHNLVTHNMEHGTKKSKRKIILTGCLAHRKDVQRRLKDKIDLFFNINEIDRLKEFIGKIKNQNAKCKITNQNSKLIRNSKLEIQKFINFPPRHKCKFSAYVPIMTGCNNFCAYCVVPYARGREISRPAEEIINEVKALVKNSCKEIILLGQNVNSYASEFPISNFQFPIKSKSKNSKIKTLKIDLKFKIKNLKLNFSDLLREIDAIPGNFWISFLSNHPKDFTDELIETATQLPKVCEYIHLPIQAGDDEILKKMNRKYTAKQYLEKIQKIKAAFLNNKPQKLFSITSDIIVGFPGETKKQFRRSAEIMKKVEFDMVYLARYSPRPETAAWNMEDNVSKKEKKKRERYLNEILKKTALENNKKYVGKILEVLVEKKKDNVYFGRTRTMKNVKFKSSQKNLIGKFAKIKIAKANIWNLEAIPENKKGRVSPPNIRLLS